MTFRFDFAVEEGALVLRLPSEREAGYLLSLLLKAKFGREHEDQFLASPFTRQIIDELVAFISLARPEAIENLAEAKFSSEAFPTVVRRLAGGEEWAYAPEARRTLIRDALHPYVVDEDFVSAIYAQVEKVRSGPNS